MSVQEDASDRKYKLHQKPINITDKRRNESRCSPNYFQADGTTTTLLLRSMCNTLEHIAFQNLPISQMLRFWFFRSFFLM